MKIYTKILEIATHKEVEFGDITKEINSILAEFGTKTGMVLIQTMNTTTAVYVNENEKFLFEDLHAHLEKQVPKGGFKHDQIAERGCPEDEPLNGHAHVKATFYGNPSVTLAYDNGKLTIGGWQSVIFVEHDGPCPRNNKIGCRKLLIRAIGD